MHASSYEMEGKRSNLLNMTNRKIQICPACNRATEIVWVNSHGQCSFCKTVIEPCCQNETADEENKNDIKKDWNILVHDDLLATGGTACAASELMQQLGVKVAAFAFVISLDFLNGNERLEKYSKEQDNQLHVLFSLMKLIQLRQLEEQEEKLK